jgi:hypothetical protein
MRRGDRTAERGGAASLDAGRQPSSKILRATAQVTGTATTTPMAAAAKSGRSVSNPAVRATTMDDPAKVVATNE